MNAQLRITINELIVQVYSTPGNATGDVRIDIYESGSSDMISMNSDELDTIYDLVQGFVKDADNL